MQGIKEAIEEAGSEISQLCLSKPYIESDDINNILFKAGAKWALGLVGDCHSCKHLEDHVCQASTKYGIQCNWELDPKILEG